MRKLSSRLLSVFLGLGMFTSLLSVPVQSVFAATTPPPPAITMRVLSVEQGGIVRIEFNNLPAGLYFPVHESNGGGKGMNGYLVAGFHSGAGGSLIGTFEIAQPLVGDSTIDLRIDGGKNGPSAFISFANAPFNTAKGATASVPVTGATTATTTTTTGGSGGAFPVSVSKGGVSIAVTSVTAGAYVTFTASGLPTGINSKYWKAWPAPAPSMGFTWPISPRTPRE
jgi:hypothetical protein